MPGRGFGLSFIFLWFQALANDSINSRGGRLVLGACGSINCFIRMRAVDESQL